jgi:hypothetical protein
VDRRAFGATGEEKKCPRRRRFFFSHVAEKSRSSSFSLALMPSIYPVGLKDAPRKVLLSSNCTAAAKERRCRGLLREKVDKKSYKARLKDSLEKDLHHHQLTSARLLALLPPPFEKKLLVREQKTEKT